MVVSKVVTPFIMVPYCYPLQCAEIPFLLQRTTEQEETGSKYPVVLIKSYLGECPLCLAASITDAGTDGPLLPERWNAGGAGLQRGERVRKCSIRPTCFIADGFVDGTLAAGRAPAG